MDSYLTLKKNLLSLPLLKIGFFVKICVKNLMGRDVSVFLATCKRVCMHMHECIWRPEVGISWGVLWNLGVHQLD